MSFTQFLLVLILIALLGGGSFLLGAAQFALWGVGIVIGLAILWGILKIIGAMIAAAGNGIANYINDVMAYWEAFTDGANIFFGTVIQKRRIPARNESESLHIFETPFIYVGWVAFLPICCALRGVREVKQDTGFFAKAFTGVGFILLTGLATVVWAAIWMVFFPSLRIQ